MTLKVSKTIEFSNTPVPRGVVIREVSCLDLGDEWVEVTEVVRSSVSLGIATRRTVQIQAVFSREALVGRVWQDDRGCRVFPE